MFRYITALFVLILAAAECWAVQPYTPAQADPVLEPWRWRSFPELKGLGLRCMAEDTAGNMWFGIDAGVVRYDGVTWQTYRRMTGSTERPWIACWVRGMAMCMRAQNWESADSPEGPGAECIPQRATYLCT